MTEKEFETFLITCNEEVRAKQADLTQEYGLREYTKYSFNQADRSLTLKKENGKSISFDVACIGSWNKEDESWVWAWSNENLSEAIRKEAEGLKVLADLTGFELFEKEGVKCEEVVARDLAFMGVHQLKAKGVYRIVTDEGYLFLAIKGVK